MDYAPEYVAMEGPWSLHEVYVSRYMGVKIMSK